MVVYGDSHAGMWLPALDGIGKRAGIKVVPLVKVGCGPYDVTQLHDGQAYPACPECRDWAMAQIAEIRPDVVVLSAAAAAVMDPKECLTAPGADMASCTGPAETVETAVNPLQHSAADAAGADWVDVSRLLCVQDRRRGSWSPTGWVECRRSPFTTREPTRACHPRQDPPHRRGKDPP